MIDPYTDEPGRVAQALVLRAHDLLNAIDDREHSTARRTAKKMRRAMRDIDGRLEELERGLLHDLRVRAKAERLASKAAVPNPYRSIPMRGSSDTKQLSRLSDEDLLEHLRYENWRMNHEPNPYSRWWISKGFSNARRALEARGYEDDAWMDGTEEFYE